MVTPVKDQGQFWCMLVSLLQVRMKERGHSAQATLCLSARNGSLIATAGVPDVRSTRTEKQVAHAHLQAAQRVSFSPAGMSISRVQPVIFSVGIECATSSFRHARVIEEQFRRRNSLL